MKFWNPAFVIVCFIPGIVFIVLHLIFGSTLNAIWQTVMLGVLMFNNHLLCENYNLKNKVIETAKDNLELIELSKAIIEENKRKEGNK